VFVAKHSGGVPTTGIHWWVEQRVETLETMIIAASSPGQQRTATEATPDFRLLNRICSSQQQTAIQRCSEAEGSKLNNSMKICEQLAASVVYVTSISM
jgi:hypothetical protein